MNAQIACQFALEEMDQEKIVELVDDKNGLVIASNERNNNDLRSQRRRTVSETSNEELRTTDTSE